MTRRLRLICVLPALLLVDGVAAAQTYRCDWSSIGPGGGPMSGADRALNCSVGQTSAGILTSTDRLDWVGFWSGSIPIPIIATRTSDAKLLPDQTLVCVAGKVATSSESDFSGLLYIEDESKAGGMRVVFPVGSVSGLSRETSIVNVIGTMGTSDAGERQVSAWLLVIVSERTYPLGPVAMANDSLGGVDLGAPPLGQPGVTDGVGANNVGLLVRTFGTVVEVSGGHMLISDGSHDTARVSVAGFSGLPAVGGFVWVTGISSLYPSGEEKLRLVLPRLRSDIWPP